MMSAISTFVRLTWVWADFASVAEFDLAVSFDLETGVLWVFEVFLLSMLFLISAKEMFAVFTAETEARAPSVFAGILSLTRLDNFALSGDTQAELAKLCTWLAVFSVIELRMLLPAQVSRKVINDPAATTFKSKSFLLRIDWLQHLTRSKMEGDLEDKTAESTFLIISSSISG